jgi:S1-C subfamily serine protease
VLVSLDGAPVTGVDDLTWLLDDKRIGQRVRASAIRGGAVVAVELVPEERPAGD